MSETLEDAAREWGQFAIKSWTAAALTGIGFTLIDLNTILATLTPLYLAAVVLIVAAISLTAAVLESLWAFILWNRPSRRACAPRIWAVPEMWRC